MTDAVRTENATPTHTPGPWTVVWIGGNFSIRTEDHSVAFTNSASKSRRAVTAKINSVAEQEANARLLASAPELLEALQALSRLYSHAWDRTDGSLVMLPPSIPAFEEAHEKASKAIEKALGK